MNCTITKKGRLRQKKDNGNLILYRFEQCNRPKVEREKTEEELVWESFLGGKISNEDYKKCTDEINKYIPKRKDVKKYYWGVSSRTNFEELKKVAEEDGTCLSIAKVPKNKVFVGNFDVVASMCAHDMSDKEKKSRAKKYKMISFTELENMKPVDRRKKFGCGNFEFLVK